MTAYTLPTAFTTSCGLLVRNDYNTFFRFPSKNTFWMLLFFRWKPQALKKRRCKNTRCRYLVLNTSWHEHILITRRGNAKLNSYNGFISLTDQWPVQEIIHCTKSVLFQNTIYEGSNHTHEPDVAQCSARKHAQYDKHVFKKRFSTKTATSEKCFWKENERMCCSHF